MATLYLCPDTWSTGGSEGSMGAPPENAETTIASFGGVILQAARSAWRKEMKDNRKEDRRN
jgi:hypothetical protein